MYTYLPTCLYVYIHVNILTDFSTPKVYLIFKKKKTCDTDIPWSWLIIQYNKLFQHQTHRVADQIPGIYNTVHVYRKGCNMFTSI